MASKRGGSRVKPYSLTVKTYTASGKLSRKNIRLSSSKPYILPQENSPRDNEALSNSSAEFETNDILDDRESMDEDHEKEQDIRSRYVRRRIKEGECWKSVQDELVKTYIENSVMLPNQICVKCVEDGRPHSSVQIAKIRCLDCGPNQFFCHHCAEKLHKTRNLFHVVEIWKVKPSIIVLSILTFIHVANLYTSINKAKSVLIIMFQVLWNMYCLHFSIFMRYFNF